MSKIERRLRLYAKLVALYPASYRERYGAQLLQTTADMLDAAPNYAGRVKICTRIALDLPLDIARQQISYVGGTVQHETPQFIKRNSLIALVLLLPFIAALSANRLDGIMYHHTLLKSWLWTKPYIGLWVLYFPELSFLIALVSCAVYVRKARQNGGVQLKAVMSLRQAGLVFVPALLAMGILFIVAFHDSAQCITSTSPSYLIRHGRAVWQCVNDNRSFTQEFTKFL